MSKGFTLIELLVVIAIIGILSTILFASFTSVQQRTRDGRRKADLKSIQHALELYRADQAAYPGTIPNCTTSPGTSAITGPSCAVPTYLQKIPADPISGTYGYSVSADLSTYSLWACLENTNDPEGDRPTDKNKCPSSATVSYTLQNP